MNIAFFRRLSIRTLLTGLVFGLTALGLGLGLGLLAKQRVAELEEELLSTTEMLAQTVAEYTESSLAFSDPEDAAAALTKLKSIAIVEAATLYDADGNVFATYAQPSTSHSLPQSPRALAFSEIVDELVLVQRPVNHDGTRYGTILLQSSATALASKRQSFFLALGALFSLLMTLSGVIAWLVHRVITRPIQELSDIASRVASGEKAPTNLGPRGNGEVRVLAESLDKMFRELNRRAVALESSHATVEGLVASSPLAIVGTGPDKRVALWSYQAELIFEIPATQAMGSKIDEILGGTPFGHLWQQRLESSNTHAEECIWQNKQGVAFELRVSASSFRTNDKSAERHSTVLVVDDVTSRNAAQTALTEKDRQLQRVQKLEVVGRMAAGVAHDFNNLLTVITGCSSLLEVIAEENKDDEVAELATSMLDAATRGAALTSRLLTFGAPGPLSIQSLDLCSALKAFEPLLRSVVVESVELSIELPDAPIQSLVDRGQLEQVLLNLVINARDALTDGGSILLSLHEEGPQAIITCKDSGSGMSDSTLTKIFQPFFTTKERGTGLGLATSRQIMHSFDGDLTCESKVGKGTTMTLNLPLTDRTRGPISIPLPETAPSSRATILLVEDELAIRALVKRILERQGYAVIATEGPEHALILAQDPRLKLDILLSDVVMPGMSGPALAELILQHRPDLPILLMSGHVGDVLKTHGLRSAKTDVLQKPFRPAELTTRLELVLRKAKQGTPGTTQREDGGVK